MSLKYEPASEPLHISVEWLFLKVMGMRQVMKPACGSDPTVGSYGCAVSYERGTPVLPSVKRDSGFASVGLTNYSQVSMEIEYEQVSMLFSSNPCKRQVMKPACGSDPDTEDCFTDDEARAYVLQNYAMFSAAYSGQA